MEDTWSRSQVSVGGTSLTMESKDADDTKRRKQTTRERKEMNDLQEIVRKSQGPLERIENDVIRRFLEKNTEAGDFIHRDLSNKRKTVLGKGKETPSAEPDMNKTTNSVSKPYTNGNGKQTTPRKQSPATDTQTSDGPRILADLIPAPVKQAVDNCSSLINVDFNTELSVSHKHYDKWARTKRVAVINRHFFPDPRFLKLKLSQDPFSFSSLSTDFNEFPDDDFDKDPKVETPVYAYDNTSGDNIPPEVVQDEKSEEAPSMKNYSDPIPEPHFKGEKSEISDGYSQSSDMTSGKDHDDMIINDMEFSKHRSLYRRRRSSLIVTDDVLDSLRDACSAVIKFAQKNDRKLVLSRRVSRNDILFSLDEEIRKNLERIANYESLQLDRSQSQNGAIEANGNDDEYFDEDDDREDSEENSYEDNTEENVDHGVEETRCPSQGSDKSACSTPSQHRRCLEKVHSYRIPLSISKSTPEFSKRDLFLDFHSRRVEKHLSRVQNRKERNPSLPATNIYSSDELARVNFQNYTSAGGTPRSYNSETNCNKLRGGHFPRLRSREPIRWRYRAMHPGIEKSYGFGPRNNGFLLRNKYGEVTDHSNLCFLAPLLSKTGNSTFKNFKII